MRKSILISAFGLIAVAVVSAAFLVPGIRPPAAPPPSPKLEPGLLEGISLAGWKMQLITGGDESRREAAEVLGREKSDTKSAIEALTRALRDRDAGVRREASKSLGGFGEGSSDAIEALEMQLAEETDDEARRAMARALVQKFPGSEQVLTGRLRHSGDETWRAIVEAVGWSTPVSSKLAARLVEGLLSEKQSQWGVPYRVVASLEAMAPASARVMERILKDAGHPQRERLLSVLREREWSASIFLELLRSPESAVRIFALDAFRWGNLPESAITEIVRALDDENRTVRIHAAISLDSRDLTLGPNYKVAAILLDALAGTADDSDSNEYVERLLSGTYFYSAPREAVPTLVEFIVRSKSSESKTCALLTLRTIHPKREELPILLRCLDEEYRYLGAWAMQSLVEDLPSDDDVIIPCCAESLSHRNSGVRAGAVFALARRGPYAIPLLVERLDDGPEAAWALGEMGPAAGSAIPALKKALKSGKPRVRIQAAWALCTIDYRKEVADLAVPVIIEIVSQDPLSPDIHWGIRALGDIGPLAEAALPALRDIERKEKDPQTVLYPFSACPAIFEIEPITKDNLGKHLSGFGNDPSTIRLLKRLDPVVLPLLLRKLQHEDAGVRQTAARALRHVPQAVAQIPALSQAWSKETDPRVREDIVATLRNIAPRDPRVSAIVRAALADKDEGVRQAAAPPVAPRSLVADAPVRSTVPELVDALRDKSYLVRYKAADDLSRLGPEARDAIPELIAILKGRDCYGRWWAAHALGKIGPSAREALAALRESAADPIPAVGKRAGMAIREIEGESP